MRCAMCAAARSRTPLLAHGGTFLQCQTYAAATLGETKLKGPAKKEEDWQQSLLKTLSSEYKGVQKSHREVHAVKAAQAQIMRFTIKNDMQALVRFFETQNRAKMRTAHQDEVIGLTLFVFYKRFQALLSTADGADASKALTLFLNLGKLWPNMRRLGVNGNAMSLLLLNTMADWQTRRPTDEFSTQIADILESMRESSRRNIFAIRVADCSLFIDAKQREAIENEWKFLSDADPLPQRRIDDVTRYDKAMVLVSSLQEPISVDNYKGNPFHLGDVSKKDYEENFSKHLELESTAWLSVPNVIGSTAKVTRHAEDLIEDWRWRDKIGTHLDHLNPRKMQPLVASCLEVLDRSCLVELLHSASMAVCSQGQNLVAVSSFHFDVVMPIVRELQKSFKARLGYDEDRIWKAVFGEYVKYFDDEQLARKFTHREFWDGACRKASVAPDFQFPMGQLDAGTRQEMATVFSEVLIKSCVFPQESRSGVLPAFSFRAVTAEEESRVTGEARLSLSRMLALHPQMMALFDRHPFRHILFTPQQLPMTVPPRPWIDFGLGGPMYKSRSDIIRNMYEYKGVDINKETRSRIKTPRQARPVFDALNQLGSTPWVINEKMLDVLKEVFMRSKDVNSKPLLDKLGVPMRAETIDVPIYKELFGDVDKKDLEPQKWRNYAKQKAMAIKSRNECNSLWCWMLYRVVLAEHFKGSVLFFPHNMDFRGRVYPLSPYLSHMGDDVNRCILKFAKAQPLGDKGLQWLKLHSINLTGKLKRSSVSDRLLEAEKLLPAIIDSAENPLNGGCWWMESDEPWQTLAACIEINDALKFAGRVEDFPSRLPVHQDGSCNGLQHYAALGRDKEGGMQVNLAACELPNDVYSDVAQRVEQKRLEDEKGGDDVEVATKLRAAMPQSVPRKVIKQTVMTTVYGVTMFGAVQQIKRQLKALDTPSDDAPAFARYLARKTFASLNDAFTSSMMLKDWFRQCAKGTSELMRTVEWVTPLGLPVVQPYLRAVDKRGKLVFSPISSKQVDAFPPNFVHSLDSVHMMLTSLHCSRKGVTFAAVHDCFWTHARNVDAMNVVCREQFIGLHSLPIVQQCSDWFISKYLPEVVTTTMTTNDVRKYTEIFTPKFEQGQLNIEDVRNSVYFFS